MNAGIATALTAAPNELVPAPHFTDAPALVAALRPEDPYFCVRTGVLADTARHFVAHFDGDVLYAVKCNHDLHVLQALWQGGIRHFDVASIAEISRVKTLFPEAHCYFMHPVKSRSAIREAFHVWGVTSFVVDHADELAKIADELGSLHGIRIMIRLETRKGAAVYDLGGKFGASVAAAANLMRQAATLGAMVGLTFHVGSQCLDPAAWVDALGLVAEAIKTSGVTPDIIDVGGGYPTNYVGVPADDFAVFAKVIRDQIAGLGIACRVWCEPGRALVAPGASVVTQIQLRRDRQIYLNDGFHGSLSFITHEKLYPPIRLIPGDGRVVTSEMIDGLTFFGPTCDSIDVFSAPNFALPADCREGDWIEFGNAGAYSIALANPFNGFDRHHVVTVDDNGIWEKPQMR